MWDHSHPTGIRAGGVGPLSPYRYQSRRPLSPYRYQSRRPLSPYRYQRRRPLSPYRYQSRRCGTTLTLQVSEQEVWDHSHPTGIRAGGVGPLSPYMYQSRRCGSLSAYRYQSRRCGTTLTLQVSEQEVWDHSHPTGIRAGGVGHSQPTGIKGKPAEDVGRP